MSDLFTIPDKGGNTLSYRRDGEAFYTPGFPGGRVVKLPQLKMRDDDILVTGWMRSGTHWTWELVNMLVNKKAETIAKFKEDHMFEYASPEYLDALPSRRVFNTHLQFRLLPDEMKTRPIKVVFVMRNPRDALLSWYRMQLAHSPFQYKGKWEDWLPCSLEGILDWGSWFDHVRTWEKAFDTHPNIGVYFLHYENNKKDPIGELRNVANFLGCDVDEDLIKAIADKCHIDKMREDKKKYEWSVDGDLHYKIGKIGTWKSVFTVEQYELFEKTYREKMVGSRFEEMYKGPIDIL